MSFSPSAKFIALTSGDSETIHIFLPGKGPTSYIQKGEWSYFKIRGIKETNCTVLFHPKEETKLLVITNSGHYYTAEFDTEKGGEITMS